MKKYHCKAAGVDVEVHADKLVVKMGDRILATAEDGSGTVQVLADGLGGYTEWYGGTQLAKVVLRFNKNTYELQPWRDLERPAAAIGFTLVE